MNTKSQNNDSDLKKKSTKALGQYGIIGIQFGVASIIGFLIGRWIDSLCGTKPFFTIFLTFCGIASATIDFFKLIKKAKNNPDEL